MEGAPARARKEMKGDRGRGKIQQQSNTETGDGFQIQVWLVPRQGCHGAVQGCLGPEQGKPLVPPPTPRAASALLFAPVSGEGPPCSGEHLAPEELRTGLGRAHSFLLRDQAHLVLLKVLAFPKKTSCSKILWDSRNNLPAAFVSGIVNTSIGMVLGNSQLSSGCSAFSDKSSLTTKQQNQTQA